MMCVFVCVQAVHSATSFISTSDSDVSPHTSAIVVDDSSISTRDGWVESGVDGDVEFRKRAGAGGKLVGPVDISLA